MQCDHCFTALPHEGIHVDEEVHAPLRSVAGDPTKVSMRRFLAFLIDHVLIAGAMVFAWSLMGNQIPEVPKGWTDKVERAARATDFQALGQLISEIWSVYLPMILIWLAISAVYLVFVQAFTGATLGKALFGIRVVGSRGRAPGLGSAFVRWLLLPIDSLALCIPAGISMTFTKGHRRLGDLAGATYVVDLSAAGRKIQVTPRGVLALAR